MSHILIRNAVTVLTMDDDRSELSGADIHIKGGVIHAIGQGLKAPGAEEIEAGACVVRRASSTPTTTSIRP